MTRLRVISWNLHGAAKPRLDAVVDLLQTHEPDVVAFQEVRRSQARRISALLRWRRPAWALKHNAYWPLWWRAEGLAVLSRHPLAVLPTVVLTPGISRRTFRRRILVPVEVVLEDDQRVLLIDSHLSSGGTEDEERRTAQAAHLVALIPDTIPVVVAGDLNTDPAAGAIVTLLAAGFADAWAVAGAGSGFTSPAHAPRRRIDYVLARRARVVEAEVIDDLGAAMSGLSDHRPLLATLEVDEPAPAYEVDEPEPAAEPELDV